MKRTRSEISPLAASALDMFRLVAQKHSLTPAETLLVAVCECALDIDVDHIAATCKLARVSDDQIQLHAAEIGTETELRPAMVGNVRKFVQFFAVLDRLRVVQLDDPIAGRTLLGFRDIRILDKPKWLAVVHFACDALQYFASRITVYERLLDFGYAPLKYIARSRDPASPQQPKSPTEKKIALLLNTPHWTFYKYRLDRNVKRYTNGHAKPEDSLDVLARLAVQQGQK
jgi:hypothetical protein